jgi:hypothetical protein
MIRALDRERYTVILGLRQHFVHEFPEVVRVKVSFRTNEAEEADEDLGRQYLDRLIMR